ncbi:sugar ABC transporter permease [Natronoglycomyces albus]|uniref:Sugar ABC transporter permease n=1 Tax=Natronoglycomyces albus TaxID=2811108 RepID=A0A895XU90_9ACTN|nr:sugar ABC transporter permease [Natronoglycomyces albus]
MRQRSKGTKFRRWVLEKGWRHAFAWIMCVFSLIPIVFVVSAAFNPIGTLSSTSLIPTQGFSLNNVRDLFTHPNIPFMRWYGNTIMIAFTAAFISILISSLAAYAFSRFRFHGRRVGLLTLLLIQMFPNFLAIVALFLIVGSIGEYFPAFGLNSAWGLILVYMGGALGVSTWLMKGFFDTIPKALDEAAYIDGATHAQIYFRVILPLASPIIAISGLLAFVGTMNDFIIASLFLTDRDSMTLAVGLHSMVVENVRASQWGMFAVGTLLTAVLTVTVFMSLQRYIVSGLTGGAVKG